jgi:hypothetical protein
LLTVTHRQEALSRAYIQAVASKCGMNCSFREFDYGIDVTLHEITRRGNRYVESGFKLDIQAKSSINVIFGETIIKYDTEKKNYNDLRDPNVGTPRILVLLALPELENDWAFFSEDNLVLKKCAYWATLKGLVASPNQSTVRVSIPRSNCFHAVALLGIMERIRAGINP